MARTERIARPTASSLHHSRAQRAVLLAALQGGACLGKHHILTNCSHPHALLPQATPLHRRLATPSAGLPCLWGDVSCWTGSCSPFETHVASGRPKGLEMSEGNLHTPMCNITLTGVSAPPVPTPYTPSPDPQTPCPPGVLHEVGAPAAHPDGEAARGDQPGGL